jgi:hypothetical protein
MVDVAKQCSSWAVFRDSLNEVLQDIYIKQQEATDGSSS